MSEGVRRKKIAEFVVLLRAGKALEEPWYSPCNQCDEAGKDDREPFSARQGGKSPLASAEKAGAEPRGEDCQENRNPEQNRFNQKELDQPTVIGCLRVKM